MEVELIAITRYLKGVGDLEELFEEAGRICYRSRSSEKRSARDFVVKRVRDGHESIIEHGSATFRVEGISRACSHQLVRHRLASYSQESQRYVEAVAGDEFVVPEVMRESEELMGLWEEWKETTQSYYNLFRTLGVRKEDARAVLPNAFPTRLIMTMNFRELRHFFHMRLDRKAQSEIRELARRCLYLVYPHARGVFREFVENP